MEIIDILGVPHAYDLTPPPRNSSSPVLVFIHGWLLSRKYWQPLIERLAPDYQCLSYDLRGFGDSHASPVAEKQKTSSQLSGSNLQSLSSSGYTLAAYAQDLGILLERLDIHSCWLVGHSLGGSIALWGADYLNHKIKGVFCLNSGGGIYIKEEFERFRTAGQQLIKYRPRWLSYIPLIDLLFTRAMVAHPIDRYWGRQRVLDLVKADTKTALGALLDSTTEAEVHLLPQVVSRLKQPVYFFAGVLDTVMEPKYVYHLASFHSLFGTCGSNVIEIPNCGHMSMVEQPDILVSKMRKFMNNYSS